MRSNGRMDLTKGTHFIQSLGVDYQCSFHAKPLKCLCHFMDLAEDGTNFVRSDEIILFSKQKDSLFDPRVKAFSYSNAQ